MSKGLFTLTEPSAQQLQNLLERNQGAPFSYEAVGASRRGELPEGYNIDRHRLRLGSSRKMFEAGRRAIRSWAMFDLGWVSIYPRKPDILPGAVVAVVASHFGFWSANLSRVVYVEDQDSVFGFAYGTLPEHAESGEERFTVTWNESDDSVWYEVLAFSKPRHPAARAGYPLSRMLQRRFARDSMAAMQRYVRAAI